jgi:hypothetical protein
MKVIAEGRANERHAGSGYLYLVVTNDRILWTDYVTPARVSALAFADVTAFREEYESHRYFLRMHHEPVRRLERAPKHRVLWFEWGNTMKLQEGRETHFLFSRRDTRAARAIANVWMCSGIDCKRDAGLRNTNSTSCAKRTASTEAYCDGQFCVSWHRTEW